jgi:hypothetical protein
MSFAYTVQSPVTATGTDQASAFKLDAESDYFFIETSTPNAGVLLPKCSNGTQYTVVNHTANSIRVYPQPTGTIDGGAPNAFSVLAATVSVRFITDDGLNFHSLIDTVSAIAPTVPANNVLVTNSSGQVVAGGGYSGGNNSFVITDSKGGINVSSIGATGSTFTNSTITSLNAGTSTVTGNQTVGGSLNVAGTSTLPTIQTSSLSVSGPVNITGNVNVPSGAVVVPGGVNTGALTVSGTSSLQNVTCNNVTASNLTLNTSFSTNTLTCTQVNCSGPVTGTNLTLSGAANCQTLTATGPSTLQNVNCNNLTLSGSANCQSITATGPSTLQNVTCSNLTASNLTLNNSFSTNALTCTQVTCSGPLSGTALTVTGAVNCQGLGTDGLTCDDMDAKSVQTFGLVATGVSDLKTIVNNQNLTSSNATITTLNSTNATFQTANMTNANVSSLLGTTATMANVNCTNLSTNTLTVASVPFQAVAFTQSPTVNSLNGVLKIGPVNMSAGQSLVFTFNNSFIKQHNVVLLDCWMDLMGTTNQAPLYQKRSQADGNIVFTITNPGSNAYVSTSLALQWIIFG